MSDVTTRLWERAEASIAAVANQIGGGDLPIRRMAKDATVAFLRQMSDEIEQAEVDEVVWPDSGDMEILADELESRDE